MLRAVVTQSGDAYAVHLVRTAPQAEEEEHAEEGAEDGHSTVGTAPEGEVIHVSEEIAEPGPNPIVPEIKEVAWGAGAFIVFAVLMRYVLFPRLKSGMDARYQGIQADHATAEATRAAAQADVAEYQAQLAAVKAEAAGQLDEARQKVEAERTERLAVVNAEIAQQRAAAAAENDAARVAVQDQIQAAVSDVTGRVIELAVGKRPDAASIDRVVSDVVSGAVTR